ncbi:MAG TPA: glycosyltransferase [Polyangia bacterium]|nr:glycosyltransferase [Polyangia bacterium]
MKVHLLFEHGGDSRPHGCSHIRLLLPFAHARNANLIEWTTGTSYDGGADIVVVERMWRPDHITIAEAQALIARVRADGARLVYTLDDNLLDLTPWSALQRGLSDEQRAVVRLFARAADGIVVSTEPLRQRMSRLNPRVVVVPNAVDETLFRLDAPQPVRDSGAPLTIGLMGTFSHDGDLMMVLEPLRAVLRRHAGRVRLQIVGAVGDEAVLGAFDGLPVETLNRDRPVAYPEFVAWMVDTLRWDLALAPLEDTPFTRCKSDLKLLDYAALGIPGIFSHVTPYAASVRHRQTGWLAANDVGAWREALESLIADGEQRRDIALRGREYVRAERTLARTADAWPRALAELSGAVQPVS